MREVAVAINGGAGHEVRDLPLRFRGKALGDRRAYGVLPCRREMRQAFAHEARCGRPVDGEQPDRHVLGEVDFRRLAPRVDTEQTGGVDKRQRDAAFPLFDRRGRRKRRQGGSRPMHCRAIFAHQTPGIRRLVFAWYATYSSPNASSIICSSARRRKANRIPKETRYEGPTTRFGTTRH